MGGERTSIPTLALRLKASVSTVKCDLAVLTVDRGYPIMTEQGHGGGVYMMEFRHSHKRILSKEQIAALNTAISVTDENTAFHLRNILTAYGL